MLRPEQQWPHPCKGKGNGGIVVLQSTCSLTLGTDATAPVMKHGCQNNDMNAKARAMAPMPRPEQSNGTNAQTRSEHND